MPASSFGYKEDCGYPKFKDPRFITSTCFGILVVIAVITWFTYKTPQQDEAIQRKICEKSGGRWVYDHNELTGSGPSRRVYGCKQDEAAGAETPAP